MRIVVFLLGFPGIFLTALGGLALVATNFFFGFLKDTLQVEVSESLLTSPWGYPNGDVGLFFIIAAFYGFVGILFALFRCGKQGASLLILPLFCAAFLHPFVAMLASLQALTALLAFFIGPLPINAALPDADKDAEED